MNIIIAVVIAMVFGGIVLAVPNGPFRCVMNGEARELGLLRLGITLSILFCGLAIMVGWLAYKILGVIL